MRSIRLFCMIAAFSTLAAGCGRDNPLSTGETGASASEPALTTNDGWGPTHTYEVTLENLSTGQPISPPVVATHRANVRMFKPGHDASAEIEAIAENGDGAPMVFLLDGADGVTDVVDVGMPLTRAGTTAGDFTDHATFQISGRAWDRISAAGMLICSNDGFAGLNSGKLPQSGEVVYYLRAYDAGTEYNTESSADIVDGCSALGPFPLPGDPDGNENDAVDTQPRENVRDHPGITGDGDLTQDHAWDERVVRMTVRRIEAPKRYRVTIRNLSGGQPLSPPVAATHRRGMHVFSVGHMASAQLEAIAEDGNQIPMFDMLSASPNVTEAVDVGQPITRKETTVGDFTDEVTFEISGLPGDRLSLAAMLICTNDGFTGLDGVPLPGHERRRYRLYGWDAGTERNTEESGDIVDACSALGAVALPGDPNGNENDAVDSTPHQRIRWHRGIRGGHDLTRTDHGWRGPVAEVVVERID